MTDRAPPCGIEEAFAVALETPEAERDVVVRSLLPDEAARAELYRLLGRHAGLEASGEVFLDRIDPDAAAMLLRADAVPPEQIGRYRVDRELARGGNGVVYLASDPELERPVAIKVLPHERTGSAGARERLKAEARAASALDHPRIATVHEIGRTPLGELFIVMGYYAGDTLRARLAGGSLPVAEAVRIGLELAEALTAAHAKGIVHRDVKPENVILTEHGVRLVDFGVAATAEPGSRAAGAGTVGYMSPEQARGAPADPRADVWAVGVVLYEMLAGERPFSGRGPEEILEAIRTAEPPSLRRLRPRVPSGLARLVHACLEKDPDRRPRDAGAVRQRLAWLRRRRRSALATTAAVMLVGAPSGLLLVRRPAPVRPPGGTTDAIAESLYVKGMALLEKRTPADLEEASVAFRTAIARDSNFARPYAGLARVVAQARVERPGDLFARTRPLLQRAAELDPTLPDVMVELGWMAMWYDRDWLGAERYLRRALALDPRDPWKYHYYAAWLSAIGRLDEAVDLERRAMAVDPRGAATATHVALHLTRLRRYDEAIGLLERTLRTDTTWARTHVVLGRAYLAVGRYEEALVHLRRDDYEFAGFDPKAVLSYGLGVAGRRDEARRITAEFEARARDGYTSPVDLMACYLGLGDIERALDWAERIPADRGLMFFPRSDPMFEPLFREPRFQRVLERMGLDSATVARLPDTRAAIEAILDPDDRPGGARPGQGS